MDLTKEHIGFDRFKASQDHTDQSREEHFDFSGNSSLNTPTILRVPTEKVNSKIFIDNQTIKS